ncbi:iron chelate uptake ABC transporter family permease subunit [Pseudovibrio brasiliensis]|uniref:Iron chelate uptake ABC transporter family permease subunit n=1 Tax=Pseudovibrio brasiliensis TaxID=1898042 RepID=A0ABX8ARW4_9HYPH|nr:iron chelate uptake ABC transporter family permease subunit [Pseudovibrio brasiliensis]QUS57788.1 iron chelate uptake ABC transporter family permease subunit [Pseudovibrio brasiliensis]
MQDQPMHAKKLIIMSMLLALACIAFMIIGAKGSWGFLLVFRGTKLLALLLVSVAISVATLLFQTISGNRILTPSIMGFDALYLLVQTLLVFILGGFTYVALDGQLKFLAEVGVMLFAATLLFTTIMGKGQQDLHRMVLVGIIFGVLFRSLAGFLQRIIDPNDFAILQGASFAQFSSVDKELLGVSILLVSGCCIVIWRLRHTLDVIALGRNNAINLGVSYERTSFIVLVLVATLVSVSTALVGPVAFFGLLVTSLAHFIMNTHRHSVLLPASILIAAVILVTGQTAFERILKSQSTLSVTVEFFGGLLFLLLLFRGKMK